MTADRFVFQRDCVSRVTGKVLNVGCKEDPAALKANFGARVVNLDLRDYDDDVFHTNNGEKRPIPVDVQHDATVFPWPFADDEFDLVVFGDFLEDLQDDGCQVHILCEARRIATHICITTPEDTPERDWHHYTTTTREKLQGWLDAAGWEAEEFREVDYGFVPRGHFIFAHRKPAEPVEAPGEIVAE